MKLGVFLYDKNDPTSADLAGSLQGTPNYVVIEMTIAKLLLPLAELEVATKEQVTTLEETIKAIIEYDKKLQERLNKLKMLEKHGVDNWEGYDVAMRELYGEEEDE